MQSSLFFVMMYSLTKSFLSNMTHLHCCFLLEYSSGFPYHTLCKGTAYSSLDNLVWVSIIQLALRSLESAINSSLPSCSRRHGTYYIALLDSVVISVLICVLIVTGTQTKLVQYKQLVIYGRIPYLNISLISWAIQQSNLRHLLYYIQVCSGTPLSAPLHI